MAAVKPFSYLTGETRPPKSGFRRPDELYGTALNAVEQEDDHFFQPSAQEVFHTRDFLQPQATDRYGLEDTFYVSQQVEVNHIPQNTDAGYNRPKQSEMNDLRLQPEMATVHTKKPPEVASKYGKDQEQRSSEKIEDAGPEASQSSRYLFYRQPSQSQRPAKPLDTKADPRINVYGQVDRHKTIERETSNDNAALLRTANDNPTLVPFSYTSLLTPDPISKHHYANPELEDRTKEHEMFPPSSSFGENSDLFDNFILVGPAKSETRSVEAAPKEPPVKPRLKLLELFDPPPPLEDPTKVAILGVTNTESSDYHNGSVDNPRLRGNSPIPIKSPGVLSPFGSPTYINPVPGFSGGDRSRNTTATTETSSSAASGGEEKIGKGTSSARHATKSRCNRKLCAAILITAIITAIVCLGAGFVAGWFGKGAAFKNKQN